jgi:eukaryotic-like serine/threonine-protein kinase
VKPANILIGGGGQVKLVDLGTATASNAGQITMESEVVGTLAYISPERLAGDSVGEPAADIYALAVVAFEAISGKKPHQAETPAELLAVVDEGPPELMEAPPQLRPLLARGMDPDPRRRQPSASALVADLENALAAEEAVGALTVEPTRIRPPRRPSYPRSHVARWAAPLALCALLAVGTWIVLSGGGSGGGGSPGHRGEAASSTKSAGRSHAGAGGGAHGSDGASTPVVAAASDADGAALNDQGYTLIQEGRYAEAVPILRRAVASFPPGSTDLTYAYALYNLGHALRMAGNPQAAIPILERRLRIPDQTATVQAELDAARAAAAG